jgi:hypothetical protein
MPRPLIQRVGGKGLLLGVEFVNTEIGYKVVSVSSTAALWPGR